MKASGQIRVTAASPTVNEPSTPITKAQWAPELAQNLQSLQYRSWYRYSYFWPRWREVDVPILWPVPEAAVTVFSTPDDGCCGHPKHVQWLCSEI